MSTSSLHSISQALNLKKTGNEYKGPCPICGGNDRFWIKSGTTHQVIYGSRCGCLEKDILKEIESRGVQIREKREYIPPDDLAMYYCMIIDGNNEAGWRFNTIDIQQAAQLIPKVSPKWQKKLREGIQTMRRNCDGISG